MSAEPSEEAHSSYPIKGDLRFQQRSWMLERMAWVFIILICSAALLGAAGSGRPLTVLHSVSGELRVEFEPRTRLGAEQEFIVRARSQPGSAVTLGFSDPFVDATAIRDAIPPLRNIGRGPEGFDVSLVANAKGEAEQRLRVTSRIAGTVTFDVSVAGSPGKVRVEQRVLP